MRVADQIRTPRQTLSAAVMAAGGTTPGQSVGTFTYRLDIRGGLRQRTTLPNQPVTFNVGYRHTLPREVDNLAVLGPAGGFGGLGVSAGRIIELNVTVGQGLACALGLALDRNLSLSAIDPEAVPQALDWDYVPYGRPLQDDLPAALTRWWQQAATTLGWRAAGGHGSPLAPVVSGRRCDGRAAMPPPEPIQRSTAQGSRSARG
ncbi:MAG: FAD-dependent oxidoreductase [Cyanobacteriota bacterium]